jgi:hypothetical protein
LTDRSRNLSLKMCAFIDLFLKMFLGAKWIPWVLLTMLLGP